MAICETPTGVSAVPAVGRRETWSADHVYAGMPGPSARRFGIPDSEGLFGKPWACMDDPRGWAVAYSDGMAARLLADSEFADAVRSLHGRTLLCWCVHKGNACHTRILAEYVELLFHTKR